ncbi:long-chain fatty acid transport protein [Thermotomaculum hydrothermale]|uniref:Long-chain fatty acid transport protein n=1 Tax=Thermotomaculum hydrothermale TaxID=981385 RepID=A0A7R6SYX8_9BACT|nr:outer membrane protein transport protein [Thermotomaculum hydrothermale]BBB32192.1 long-chain fatty acid transport protein [Thermotomaculum hydrothermale]
MKKLVVLLMLITAITVFATNGDNMIGVTPSSSALGGAGVGAPVGATDEIFRNPAFLGNYKGFNMSFGAVLFFPEVRGRYSDMQHGDSGFIKSQADTFMVPEIGITYQINEKFTFGLGAFGVSGMGVDYRNRDPRLSNMNTNFQFMRTIAALSYKVNENLSLGFALDLAWGSLDIGTFLQDFHTGDAFEAGGGVSQAFGAGGQFGLAYQKNNFTFGILYQTSIPMNYDRVLDTNHDGIFEKMKLEQPDELAIGFGYRLNAWRFMFDVREIGWENTDGYGQFLWKDQTVYCLGIEYTISKQTTLKFGYNYAKSPIRNADNLDLMTPEHKVSELSATFSDFQVAWFNLLGFPAITEDHYSMGISHKFNKTFGIDFGFVYLLKRLLKLFL